MATAQTNTGSLAKKPVDCSKRCRKINDEALLAYLAEHPDAYLADIAKLFGCSINAVHKRLGHLNITRKKDHYLPQTRLEKSRMFLENVL